jgi:hypothetical protein
VVYYARWNRPRRALRNNLIVLLFLAWVYGMVRATQTTVQTCTVALVLTLVWLAVRLVLRARRRAEESLPLAQRQARVLSVELRGAGQRDLPLDPDLTPALASTADRSGPPQLRSGVPTPVIAMLLSGELGISAAEVAVRLKMRPERGQLNLPDTFPALQRQRDIIEEIIQGHMKGKVGFSWATTDSPRMLSWVPVVSSLPSLAKFRDFLPQIEACRPGDFAVGATMDGRVYTVSHNGDTPWHCMSMGSGTGKSTRFLVKAVQILHNDPDAELYCVDTKQVSFGPLKPLGLSRVHVYDDPESHMQDFWDVFYVLDGIMRERYTAVRKGEAVFESFSNIWLLVDEGNDLANQLKIYWTRRLKKSGDPAAAPIWSEAVASLINLGRQVNIRGEFMFQNMTDRALGGVSLRDAFGVYGMAGYTKNQWSRIIGTTPVPECKTGPGRIMMVRGTEQTWVQGFFDTDDYLRSYATSRA